VLPTATKTVGTLFRIELRASLVVDLLTIGVLTVASLPKMVVKSPSHQFWMCFLQHKNKSSKLRVSDHSGRWAL